MIKDEDQDASISPAEAEIGVRSTQDGARLPAKRAALRNSDVFADMFAMCDPSATPVLDLDESGEHIALLLRLLHEPPAPPTVLGEEEVEERSSRLQKTLLADKYLVNVADALREQLRAHCAEDAFAVYTLACEHREDSMAAEASQFVRPLARYTEAEVAALPNARVCHRLAALQDSRRVRSSQCCSRRTCSPTVRLRLGPIFMDLEISDTDIAGEMDAAVYPTGCEVCSAAWHRAVAMIAYKSRKAIRRTDQLGNE
ncbi:hypothetical protein BD626DRAFT_571890 [Schizophyllum amplum]|uniref:BTB domain-containing protein n=1 Tax=Schizophyllum amplum TaxID=97359 RepID=A0A550C5P8_9AGAR|nr:hypothetical protein BD626DRAFT_571890 [Auriculariopsis ampla]